MKRKTIYLISSNSSETGMMESLPPTNNLEIITKEELAKSTLVFQKNDVFSITSESVLEVLLDKIQDETKKNAILALKNKAKFREIIKPLFPDYTFETISLEKLSDFKPTKKMVVKPQKGFFGTGVRIIEKGTDISKIVEELQEELAANGTLFSEDVLSVDSFIIEDYIAGQEYAADIFYDEKGEPRIANLFCHPTPKNPHYVHMLYYTSKQVFEEISEKTIHFFKELNKILKVTNLQVHGEFKLDGNQFIPIEMNPARFGGVGLGNMIYHATKINPYECMITGHFPNWQDFWNANETQKNSIYSYLIAYNGKSIDRQKMKPNLPLFRKELGEIIKEVRVDYKKQLIFGLFTSKETPDNIEKLPNLEFDDFFEKI